MPLQITIDQFTPESEAWENASKSERRDYYSLVGREALAALRSRFLAGEDRFGAPLLPVLDPKRRVGTGPPLVPRRAASRSIRLMRFKAYEDKCVIFWEDDWGTILEYHKRGIPSRVGLRVRDVGGFTPEEEQQIRQRATRKWEQTTLAPRAARVIDQPTETPLRFGSFFRSA